VRAELNVPSPTSRDHPLPHVQRPSGGLRLCKVSSWRCRDLMGDFAELAAGLCRESAEKLVTV
jgi:hypothetical protein